MIRTTQDSDIIAEIRLDQIQAFVDALNAEFYIDDEMMADSVSHNSSFNIIHRETVFKVDIFVPQMNAFDRSRFSRAQQQTLYTEPEVRAYVSSAEDTILIKLKWYRLGGELSERQWRDVLGMLKVQSGRLELDYLKHWAEELEISDLLELALGDATP